MKLPDPRPVERFPKNPPTPVETNTKNTCEDCERSFSQNEGRYWHYEAGVWLCDACFDERLVDNG